MPEQEFPPPRRLARPYRPDRDDEEPPPWASMPSVRPARSDRPAVPAGRPGGHRRPDGPEGGYGGLGPQAAEPGAHRASDPAQGGLEAQWAQWQQPEDDAEEPYPPPRTRAPGGRAVRAAARRRRRWFLLGGGVVVAAGAVLAVVLLTGGHKAPASVTSGALITTFQAGELRQVPNACHVVPAATVQQYLPGKAKVAAPTSVSGSAGSACDWTIDQPPQYRLMELSLQAYAPNGLASGDGSATLAATDAYRLALQELRTPPKNSPAAAKATVRELTGFGDAAFTAQQVFHVGGAVTDVATVMVRYRNVVVTVTLNGLAHSNKGNYGPVSQSQLAQAAMSFAQAAVGSLR